VPAKPDGVLIPRTVPDVFQVRTAPAPDGLINANGNVLVPEPPVNSVPLNRVPAVEAAPAPENCWGEVKLFVPFVTAHREHDIAGALPPEETMGAVPVTPVTVPPPEAGAVPIDGPPFGA
jgi:hypothetical protein